MATQDAIKQALSQLDHTNDDHWTDDGLPRTSVVQKLANDATIKRVDIQAAAPNFARTTGDAMGEPQENVTAPAAAPVKAEGDNGIKSGAQQAPQETEAELEDRRAAAQEGINEAETGLSAAKRATADALKAERVATQALDKAKLDMARAFPPLTAAQNIKQHLRHEQEMRAAKVQTAPSGQVYGKDNIDAAMNGRQSRNGQRSVYSRPTRPIVNTGVAR